ncbi:septum formation family protein [Subtercola lobariae]|uniref:Septum formation-related domain-containing protein n=1 Tax=Subtercola lobariae TaxID=1588641 RepID=A0A917B634_9MICO|nr:septum formation family protein [Subtercola lobariae]GGF24574.1 hypothetical protein GCM10011399_17590 [Subtercola lobariae]
MTELTRLIARPILVAALLGLAVLSAEALTGCSALPSASQGPGPHSVSTAAGSSSSATGSPTPSVDPSEHSQDVFSLSVGDCVNGTSAGTVTDVPTVDCAAPHDLEVFYDFDLTGDAYPGDSAVSDQAKSGCGAQFQSFVGIAYDSSALDYTEYTPTADSWQGGDRTVSCVVGEPNGKTTGTLAGAAR